MRPEALQVKQVKHRSPLLFPQHMAAKVDS